MCILLMVLVKYDPDKQSAISHVMLLCSLQAQEEREEYIRQEQEARDARDREERKAREAAERDRRYQEVSVKYDDLIYKYLQSKLLNAV